MSKKWYTTTEYVDTETGEVLTKTTAKNYYKVGRSIEYLNENEYSIKKITWHMKPINQLKLF